MRYNFCYVSSLEWPVDVKQRVESLTNNERSSVRDLMLLHYCSFQGKSCLQGLSLVPKSTVVKCSSPSALSQSCTVLSPVTTTISVESCSLPFDIFLCPKSHALSQSCTVLSPVTTTISVESHSPLTFFSFRGVMWAAMNLLLVVIAYGLAIWTAGLQALDLKTNNTQGCSLRDPLMNPTHDVRYGQDTVWQIPPNPKAILFLAHGKGKGPFSFFDRTPQCKKCYGLPEDRSLLLEALRRGYAVIAVKSVDIGFSDAETSEDLVIVLNILNDWRREQLLDRDSALPFTTLGCSAGGDFATILSLKMPTRALLLMTSEGKPELVENATPERFPPTFFAYMGRDDDDDEMHLSAAGSFVARDMTTKTSVEKSMAILIQRGVPIGWKLCLRRPIHPLFFTERLPCTSDATSKSMQRAYKAEGWLNSSNYLRSDPYDDDWLTPLGKWNSWPFWYVPQESCPEDPVCQELMRAWAFHVTTGDANEEMFTWLDSILMLSDEQLLSDSR